MDNGWAKSYWVYGGGYLSYKGQFVARFKYNKPLYPKFKRFLMKHFTPDEYFAEMAKGVSPLQALQNKGFPEVTMY